MMLLKSIFNVLEFILMFSPGIYENPDTVISCLLGYLLQYHSYSCLCYVPLLYLYP